MIDRTEHLQDLRALEASEEALRQSEEQLKRITDQMPGMVFSLYQPREGPRRYHFVSSGVRDIYGFGPEDLMRDASLIITVSDFTANDLRRRFPAASRKIQRVYNGLDLARFARPEPRRDGVDRKQRNDRNDGDSGDDRQFGCDLEIGNLD